MTKLLLAVTLLLLITFHPAARAASPAATAPRLPTLFICGDSTAKSAPPIQGWGDRIAEFFDTARLTVENHAMGGRSSRIFVTEGRWETVRSHLAKGDFVLIQFGHNDTKSTMSMDRYTLPGLGDEVEQGTDPRTGKPVEIRTFGFYMRQMVSQTLAAGATPIVLSPVPRSKWAAGKIVRGEEHTGEWAAAVAKELSAPFIDVNATIADIYDPIGQPRIKALYFPQDNTHTNPQGAQLNAACITQGILQLKDTGLAAYLKDSSKAAIAQLIANVPLAAAATQPWTPPVTQPATAASRP